MTRSLLLLDQYRCMLKCETSPSPLSGYVKYIPVLLLLRFYFHKAEFCPEMVLSPWSRQCQFMIENVLKNSITWLKHFVPHLNCLDLQNAVMPLMMLWVLCDTNANVITWPKRSCTLIQLSWPKKCNAVINNNHMALILLPMVLIDQKVLLHLILTIFN